MRLSKRRVFVGCEKYWKYFPGAFLSLTELYAALFQYTNTDIEDGEDTKAAGQFLVNSI